MQPSFITNVYKRHIKIKTNITNNIIDDVYSMWLKRPTTQTATM